MIAAHVGPQQACGVARKPTPTRMTSTSRNHEWRTPTSKNTKRTTCSLSNPWAHRRCRGSHHSNPRYPRVVRSSPFTRSARPRPRSAREWLTMGCSGCGRTVTLQGTSGANRSDRMPCEVWLGARTFGSPTDLEVGAEGVEPGDLSTVPPRFWGRSAASAGFTPRTTTAEATPLATTFWRPPEIDGESPICQQ
jgi:hypothetical protein